MEVNYTGRVSFFMIDFLPEFTTLLRRLEILPSICMEGNYTGRVYSFMIEFPSMTMEGRL